MAPSRRHALAITVALALAVIHLGLHANLPQIYWFATPAGAQHSLSGLLATPLALDDDPMITLGNDSLMYKFNGTNIKSTSWLGCNN